jgi:predicted nucleic acid-binding protein
VAQEHPGAELAVMTTWLLDTGPLVACLDAADPLHPKARAVLAGFRGRLCTTGAVVTEAMHFVAEHTDGPAKLVEFLEKSRTEISDCFAPAALRQATQLMRRYADTPMDFADASLVLLAGAIGGRDVLTFDERGFRTFRTPHGKPFRLVLDTI